MHLKRDNTTDPSYAVYPLSSDSDFHFEILRLLGLASYEGADVAEVLVATNRIAPGDFDSWYDAFNSLANRVNGQAQAIDASRYPVSARNTFFKAASYFRAADFFLHGNWSDPRINSLWVQHLDAFNAALALMPVPGERVTLHAADFDIPAIFFPTGRPGKRPTIIVGNGYDGSQEELYHVWVKAALERGMNVITYEGPGQPTVRREQDLGFIPNWEDVVTPVVDYALTRAEVDPHKLGLLGFSFGGSLAPRAAAFEHRIAAVMAIDGLFDIGANTLQEFPPEAQALFNSGNKTAFNYALDKALEDPDTPTSVRWAIQQGEWAFKAPTPYDWLSELQKYGLTDVIGNVTVPVFVADPDNDDFFSGQPQILADHLGDLATHHVFESIDGAGGHCSVGAQVLQNQVVLDWFQDVVGWDCKE